MTDYLSDIMNLFLYGSTTKPENLLTDAIIRPAISEGENAVSYNVNITEYMANHGRHALGARFDIVVEFFNSTAIDALVPTGTENAVLTKAEMASFLGLEYYGLSTQQYDYADEIDDYAERVWIWNSVSYKLLDDVQFVIQPDGTRYIANYGVTIDDLGNFDFIGDYIATGVGDYSEYRTDVSLIGRSVDLIGDETTQIIPWSTYDLADFQAEQQEIASWTYVDPGIIPFNPAGNSFLLSKINPLLDEMFLSGLTSQIDSDGRPILYGTDGADELDGFQTPATGFPVYDQGGSLKTHPYYDEYYQNGVVYISGDGEDVVAGTNYSDILMGGSGIDVLRGQKGDDKLFGGNDADTMRGGKGDDYLYGHSESGEGDDGAADELYGGDGGDFLYGQGGADLLLGQQGDDHLYGGKGEDILKGGNGADVLYGHSLSGDGDDNARDVLYGNQGDDRLYGQGGNDLLLGGKHDDELYGGSGHDYLVGGTGDDKIFGEEGTDYLQGGAGADELHGGDGFDSIGYEESSSGIILNFQNGVGVGSGGDAEGDTIESIEYITGSDHADTITGWSNYGYVGPDYSFLFEGGKGRDSLEWIGGGRIEFWGQRGADTLSVSSQIETARFAFNAGNGKDELYLEGQVFGEFSGGNGVDKVFAVAPKSSSEFGSAWTALGSGVSALEFFAGEAEFEDYSDKTVDRFYLDNWELTFDLDEAAFEAGGYGEYLFFLEQSDGTIQINYEGTIGAAGEFVGDALGDIAITMWLSPQYLDDNGNVVQDLTFMAYDQNIDVELVSFNIIGFEQGDYGISFDIPSSTQSSPSSTQLISHSENPMRMESLLKDELGEEGSFDLALLEMPHKEGLSGTLFDPEFVDEHRSVVTLGEPVAEMDLASFDYDVLIADAYLGDTLAQHDWA